MYGVIGQCIKSIRWKNLEVLDGDLPILEGEFGKLLYQNHREIATYQGYKCYVALIGPAEKVGSILAIVSQVSYIHILTWN